MKLKLISMTLLMSIMISFVTAQNDTHALVGVEIFNGKSGDLQDMTVLIENGIIKDIFKTGSKPIPSAVNKIELVGHYVMPGLIDTHVHMGQKGLSEAPEASRKEFKKWIYSGVTSVRDMGGDARALFRENQLINENEQPGPNIYFTTTVGSSDQIAKDLRLKRITKGIGIENAGYVMEATADMDIKKNVSMAVNSKVTGVKFYTGLESDLIKSITKEAHDQGLKSWAHFTVFPDRPIEVVRAGVDVVSHVWGAIWQDSDVDPSERIPFIDTDFKNARTAIHPNDMSVLNTDSPELLLLFNEMRKRKVIWDLTLVVPNPETQKVYINYAVAASNAGVALCTGTDYFNDINEPFPSLFKELETFVEYDILNSRETLIAATINGAKAIGIEKTHGTIEIGKAADLVVLTKSPIENISNIREIKLTMKNGVLFYRNDYD